MPNVTTEYRLLQPAGHHRQPRSHATSVLLPGGGTAPEIAGAGGFRDAIEYSDKTFVFWSVTDGTNGFTTANTHVNYTVSAAPMTVTAWYYPEGGGGVGGSAYLIDAFSVAAGDFVNDDFVTVTSNPSLTSAANVAGVIPTASTETAEAFSSIGSEGFEHWIGASSASDRDATFAAGQSGFAIATYKRSESRFPDLGDVDIPVTGGILIGGAKVDGGGILILPGGGVSPIDPWGPLLTRLARGLALVQIGAGLKGTAAKQVQRLGAAELASVGKEITEMAAKGQR